MSNSKSLKVELKTQPGLVFMDGIRLLNDLCIMLQKNLTLRAGLVADVTVQQVSPF